MFPSPLEGEGQGEGDPPLTRPPFASTNGEAPGSVASCSGRSSGRSRRTSAGRPAPSRSRSPSPTRLVFALPPSTWERHRITRRRRWASSPTTLAPGGRGQGEGELSWRRVLSPSHPDVLGSLLAVHHPRYTESIHTHAKTGGPEGLLERHLHPPVL